MHTRKQNSYFFSLMNFRKAVIWWLLPAMLIINPHDAFAELDAVDGESAAEAELNADVTGKSISVPPVEVGSGGNIKLERKYRTKAESQFEWHTHLLWESRYVTEGRDNLSGSSLASLSSEFIIGEANFVPWYAYSPGADYSELNLNFVYGVRPTEDFAVYFGYNHIRARFEGERGIDNEVSLDLVHKLLKHIGASASIYHSFEADGAFMEMAIKYSDAVNKKIHYSVRGALGVNAGYVADGHNGLNHYQILANFSYVPVRQIELYAYTGYNLAINRDVAQYAGDEYLRDFFWGGIGFAYFFE